jgi:hypothetical protein
MFNENTFNDQAFNSQTSITGVLGPDLSFRSNVVPYNALNSLNFVQTAPSGAILPVRAGEQSNEVAFRIYNNYQLLTGIPTATNIEITVFDDVGVTTAAKSVASQQWVKMYQSGFGESSGTPGLYTYWISDEYAIGGKTNVFIPQKGSNGSLFPEIRAGSDTNGCGFIEVHAYAEVPSSAITQTTVFAIAVNYEYV